MRRAAAWLSAGAFVCLANSSAFGQCIIDYEALIPEGMTNTAAVREATTKGTFECGILAGEICSSGISTGTCLESRFVGHGVSCTGPCTVTPGDAENPGGTAACDDPATITWEGELSADCVGAVCVASGTSSDGSTSTASIAVLDPAEIAPGAEACATEGIISAHYTGVTSYPIPPF